MRIFKNVSILFLVFFTSCIISSTKQEIPEESSVTGKVIHIADGDTYDLLTDDKQTIRIRMEGIDAPERGMAFYKVSKNYLGELCMGKTIKVVKTDTDRYGRLIGFSYLSDGSEIGSLMIKAGMAWHYKQYSTDENLAQLEIEARDAKRGLWYDKNPIAPWEHRKQQREKKK